MDTSFDFRVLLSHAKFGQGSDSRSPHKCVLQDYPVVYVSDIFGGLGCLRSLYPQKMQYANSKLSKLTIFDKFTKMSERFFLTSRNKLNQIKHTLDHGSLEFIATFVS